MKYILTAYFLGNICAKNCDNRAVYVKIIASCKGGTFFDTQCTTRTVTYSYGSKFSFLQRTFTIQLPTDGRATCRRGIK